MKLNQKGQDVVEFALVMPFLLAFILLIVFFGFVFSDYLALNSLARTIARDCSLYESNTGYTTYITNTKGYSASDLPNSMYTWDPRNSGATYLRIVNNEVDGEADSVTVTLTARANQNSGLYNNVGGFIDWALGSGAEDGFRTIKVEYTMRKENGRKLSST